MRPRDSTAVDLSEAKRHAAKNENSFSVVSLYSGAGGLDLGFAAAGFFPVWANDHDPGAVATYNGFLGRELGHRASCGDIRRQELPREGAAAVVMGGPPCQGFSVAGKMDPNDPRSRHIWDFLGVVSHVQPRAFVMENVMGLAVNRRWGDLRAALLHTARRKLKYRTELITLRASDYGVPQIRERMFLVGVREGEFSPPEPTSAKRPPTVAQALSSLPPYGLPGNDTRCAAKVTPARQPVLRRSPFAGMLFNGQGRPLNLDAPALTLPASMGGNRTPIVDQIQVERGGENWVIKYHRHLWGGGAPYAKIPQRMRRLTIEEAAAIQTFPPDLKWAGRVGAQFRQIGNAVPPRLGFHVAVALREALGLGRPEAHEWLVRERAEPEAELIAA